MEQKWSENGTEMSIELCSPAEGLRNDDGPGFPEGHKEENEDGGREEEGVMEREYLIPLASSSSF